MNKLFVVIIWAAFSAGIWSAAKWMTSSVSELQKHGLPISADLISYREAWRPKTVWTSVRYVVNGSQLNAIIPIGNSIGDPDVVTMLHARSVPLLYNPQKPSSVTLNYNGSAYRKNPTRAFFLFVGVGEILMSIIVLPYAFWGSRERPQK